MCLWSTYSKEDSMHVLSSLKQSLWIQWQSSDFKASFAIFYVFKWKRLSASIVAHCRGTTEPSVPRKCAGHFLVDVAVVFPSLDGEVWDIFFCRMKLDLCGCFGDIATGCGLEHMGSLWAHSLLFFETIVPWIRSEALIYHHSCWQQVSTPSGFPLIDLLWQSKPVKITINNIKWPSIHHPGQINFVTMNYLNDTCSKMVEE